MKQEVIQKQLAGRLITGVTLGKLKTIFAKLTKRRAGGPLAIGEQTRKSA